MAESIFWFRGFHRGATDAGAHTPSLPDPASPPDPPSLTVFHLLAAGSLAFHSACFCRLSVMLAYNVNLLVIPPEQARARTPPRAAPPPSPPPPPPPRAVPCSPL